MRGFFQVNRAGFQGMITILTWLWQQPGSRIRYTTEHVNAWAEAIRRNTTLPHRIACVTDIPDGLHDWIDVIPPPRDFEGFRSAHWDQKAGLPQCYRRIAMFSPSAGEIFGERFLCMDIDMLITGNIDHILQRSEDFLIFRGTASTRPYNGGLIMMTAGARPQVYTDFTSEGAHKASSLFVGSDQAWISYCLGRGEKTLGEAEGITNYSPKFIRENGGPDEFKAPDNLCMLFFPGHVKALHSTPEIWGVAATPLDKKIINIVRAPRMPRFYAYDDPKGWGRRMKLLHGFTLINDASKVREGDHVFVRLDQQGAQREISKGLHRECAAKGAKVFPSTLDEAWYDNKIRQRDDFCWYMPETTIITDFETAFQRLHSMEYPFISKSSEGAGSANVRLIRTPAEAEAEIRLVFGEGLPISYVRKQQGYVYWQKLIPGADRDYRIVVTGDYVHGLVRLNKKGTLFASGSGNNYPMQFDDEYERKAAALAVEAARTVGTRWCAFDIVFAPDGQGYILEVSAAWTVDSYAGCSLFRADGLQRVDATGIEVFAVAAGLMRGEPPRFAELTKYQVCRAGTTYGKKGDIVTIPACDVQTLLRHGVIKRIENTEGAA